MSSHKLYGNFILIKSKQGLSNTEYIIGLCIFSAKKLGRLKMNDLITFYREF